MRSSMLGLRSPGFEKVAYMYTPRPLPPNSLPGQLSQFLARLLILIKKGGLLQLKFGVVGVGVNIYLWAR